MDEFQEYEIFCIVKIDQYGGKTNITRSVMASYCEWKRLWNSYIVGFTTKREAAWWLASFCKLELKENVLNEIIKGQVKIGSDFYAVQSCDKIQVVLDNPNDRTFLLVDNWHVLNLEVAADDYKRANAIRQEKLDRELDEAFDVLTPNATEAQRKAIVEFAHGGTRIGNIMPCKLIPEIVGVFDESNYKIPVAMFDKDGKSVSKSELIALRDGNKSTAAKSRFETE